MQIVAAAGLVVLLGAGNPGPVPERSGPATAVVVDDVAYLVDFGPGVIRRASAAFRDRKIEALEPVKLRFAFVTHLSGCDVLIHEAQTLAWRATRPERFQRFAEKVHTSTPQLAELAKQAKPRLLILYHYNSQTDQELFNDMASRYPGQFVIGRDLDVY